MSRVRRLGAVAFIAALALRSSAAPADPIAADPGEIRRHASVIESVPPARLQWRRAQDARRSANLEANAGVEVTLTIR